MRLNRYVQEEGMWSGDCFQPRFSVYDSSLLNLLSAKEEVSFFNLPQIFEASLSPRILIKRQTKAAEILFLFVVEIISEERAH